MAGPPRLRVIAGPNGSGKSTVLDQLPARFLGAYVNADEIEKQLRSPEGLCFGQYGLAAMPEEWRERLVRHLSASALLQAHALADVANQLEFPARMSVRLPAHRVNSYIAAVIADAIRRELLGQGSSFTFETVMSSPDKIRFMHRARTAGYRTYLYFVATDDPAINAERVRLRVLQGGHDVPPDKIRSRYARSIGLLDQACDAASRAYIFDNSGTGHQLIAEIHEGENLRLHVAALPAWLTRSSLWQSFQSGTQNSGPGETMARVVSGPPASPSEGT